MEYRVIRAFTDLQDGMHHYNVGDTFPRDGAVASDKRLMMLKSNANRQKAPLIEEVAEKGLNPAFPAQPEKVVQDSPKPKRTRKKKENR